MDLNELNSAQSEETIVFLVILSRVLMSNGNVGTFNFTKNLGSKMHEKGLKLLFNS